MRGKYKINDMEYIKCLLRGMTVAEQQRILEQPFDQLWEELWGPPQDSRHLYRSERESSRAKLEQLRQGTTLKELIVAAGGAWETPEWGFPKGRRDPHESEYACAIRELWEETGFKESDFQIIKNLEPLSEQFRGSNGVQYCHKYYIGRVSGAAAQRELIITPEMKQEVGEIRWVTEEEGLALIRPENAEKREMLRDVYRLLRSYIPLEIRGT
jgi:8-oxo-dGTP pyrophosphatase MutT (NUDIX family)